MPALHDLLPRIWNRRATDLEDFFDNSWPLGKAFDVDVKESEKSILIEADLPGYQKDDIQVDLEEYSVTIKAIRSTEMEEKREKYYRRERQYGSVERVIPLPAEVITDSSSAKYEDGVLKITLEKANPTISQRKSISIE